MQNLLLFFGVMIDLYLLFRVSYIKDMQGLYFINVALLDLFSNFLSSAHLPVLKLLRI